MHNLRLSFFDDSGLGTPSRILMFYSFDSEENCPRSGILHYHVLEKRFVGPRHDCELTKAALEFLVRSGRIPLEAFDAGGTLQQPPEPPPSQAR